MTNDILLAATTQEPSTPPTFSITVVVAVLVGIAIVGVGVATLFQYYKWHTSPWYSDRYYASSHIWDWMKMFTATPRVTSLGGLQQVDTSSPPPIAPVTQSTSERHPEPPSESWCFVGEDLTGRYCVKVPSASECDGDRLFRSRSDCELQKGNALPAGVANTDGSVSLLN